MKTAAIFSLIVSIIYILFQSLQPSFYLHLFPDVFAFQARALYFWNYLTLNGLGYNEYQPGAIIFFITLSPVFALGTSIEVFKWALFSANIVFLFLIAILLIKMRRTEGVFLISLFLILLGPILFFRFDLLVILLTIFTFYLWQQDKRIFAMIVLGIGVITKVYPILFLPYLLFQNFRQRKFLNSLNLLLAFSAGLLAFIILYTYIFNISLSDTLVSYNFHSNKSVSTESFWASVIYFSYVVSGNSLPGFESAYGINAIARSDVFPSIQFYNYFWILPVGLLYLLYFFKNKHWEDLDVKFLSFLLLTFLVFSKVVSNQYLAWFLFMLPLIDLKTLLAKKWVLNIFIICISLIMHTYIYPLNYSEWLSFLKMESHDLFLFWTVLVSNFLLMLLCIRMGPDVYKNNK